MQPLSGLAFVTDGIHWGTGDYAYMRNGMFAATVMSSVILLLIDPAAGSAFIWVWWAMLLWVTVRAIFGLIRIWPGVGRAPLRLQPVVQQI
jgi:MATE family multidrug resistance protein